VYAFLFLGASLCCYHFMYYDLMMSGVGVMLLLARPGRLVRPMVLTAHPADGPGPGALPDWRAYALPRLPRAHPLLGRFPAGGAWVLSSFVLTALLALLVVEHTFGWLNLTESIVGPRLPTVSRTAGMDLPEPQPLAFILTTYVYGPPWDTFIVLVLWAYAGARTALAPRHDLMIKGEPPGDEP
jgi:hypothetical protein